MATVIDSNPFPLGVIKPTPGSPVGIFQNFPDLATGIYTYANMITFQAHYGNSGKIYIGNQSLDVATDTGILYVLINYGDALSVGSFALNVIDLRNIRIDAETLGDGVFVSMFIR
jgi:hypothetical protein